MAATTARKTTLTPQERAERVEALSAELVTAVQRLADSERWRAMLEVAARFPTFSFRNHCLLWAQAEDRGVVLTRVAAFGVWRKMGYHVVVGSRAFTIFEPIITALRADEIVTWQSEGHHPFDGNGRPKRVVRGFKVGNRFDLSQVEAGPDAMPLPEDRQWISQEGRGPAGLWSALVGMTEAAGFTVDVRPSCPSDGDAHGSTNYETRVVWVNSECDEAERIRILAHETCGHIRCDHEGRTVGRRQRETEADSVAFVVLAAVGFRIDSSSVEYVAGWSGGKAEVLQDAAETIHRVAAAVLAELEDG